MVWLALEVALLGGGIGGGVGGGLESGCADVLVRAGSRVVEGGAWGGYSWGL